MKARKPAFCICCGLTLFVIAAAAAAQGSYTTYGAACQGSAGTPFLAAFGDHKIGGNTILQVVNLAPNQPAVMLFGVSDTTWSGLALPFDLAAIGMPGCSLLASAEGSLPAMTGGGVFTQQFNHPLNANLIGQSLYNQFAALDPGATTLVKVVTSNGGKLTFGAACVDGAPSTAGGTFSFQIPPIPNIGNPPVTVSGNYSGRAQQKCCAGPTSPSSGCTFSGSGTVSGQTGAFVVNVPASISQQVVAAACQEVQSATIGIVSCTGSFATLNATGLGVNGTAGVFQNACTGLFGYTGYGTMTIGTVTASPTVNFTIDLWLTTINFSTTIDIQGSPTGSYLISNNAVTASAAVTSIQASKTFTIPLLNIPITFSQTFSTPTLSGTTSPLALPPVTITCN